MGQAASSSSAELKAAEATIKRLERELRTRGQAYALKEASVLSLGQELEAAKMKLNTTTASLEVHEKKLSEIPRLESALRETRSAAEAERAKARAVESELFRTKDELERRAGEAKFANPERGHSDTVGLVVEANRALTTKERHPIFGLLIHDFGYKKLYVSNPSTLWTGTALWQKQRAFREDRATMIAEAKKEAQVKGWPGALCIAEADDLPDSGYVVDGQHRLGAAWLLKKDMNQSELDPSLNEILIEVYPATTDSKNDIFHLFAEINKAEPVPLIDMPEDQVDGGATEDERQVIDFAANQLKSQFPDMFKPSRNCRAPHLNLDFIRDEIHKAGIWRAHDATPLTGQQLVDFLLDQNSKLAALPQSRWTDRDLTPRTNSKASLETALKKAQKYNFFLGLTLRWLHEPF